jgi:hypothetical protein
VPQPGQCSDLLLLPVQVDTHTLAPAAAPLPSLPLALVLCCAGREEVELRSAAWAALDALCDAAVAADGGALCGRRGGGGRGQGRHLLAVLLLRSPLSQVSPVG